MTDKIVRMKRKNIFKIFPLFLNEFKYKICYHTRLEYFIADGVVQVIQ